MVSRKLTVVLEAVGYSFSLWNKQRAPWIQLTFHGSEQCNGGLWLYTVSGGTALMSSSHKDPLTRKSESTFDQPRPFQKCLRSNSGFRLFGKNPCKLGEWFAIWALPRIGWIFQNFGKRSCHHNFFGDEKINLSSVQILPLPSS